VYHLLEGITEPEKLAERWRREARKKEVAKNVNAVVRCSPHTLH